MAKANQKAIAIKNFELATTGIIYHPPMDVIIQCENDKKKRNRMNNLRHNIERFRTAPKHNSKRIKKLLKRSIPNYMRREQQIQKGWQPKNLPVTGGE